MSRFSKAIKKVVSKPLTTVLSPVTGGIEALTGLDWKAQMGIGAGIGAGVSMFGAPAAAGAVGGPGGQGMSSAGGFLRSLSSPQMMGSLLGAGASIYGSQQQADAVRASNEASIQMAREGMLFSSQQAAREMEFQERMSGSSYQRGIDDMRKAGINPMMAVSQGGASTPSGAMGTALQGDVDPVPSVVAGSLSSAMDVTRTYADVRKAFADADASRASADLARANVPKARAETDFTKANTEGAKFEQRTYKLFNDLFDRIKGAYDSSAKGTRMLPFIRKGESGFDLQMMP